MNNNSHKNKHSKQNVTDANTPLHLLEPNCDIPYTEPCIDEIGKQLNKIYLFLEKSTPIGLFNSEGKQITDYTSIEHDTKLIEGDFRLTSYEWGVTYFGMLNAAKVLNDSKFSSYTIKRLNFIKTICPGFQNLEEQQVVYRSPVHTVLYPETLDDAGALCVSMIKAQKITRDSDYISMIENFADYILNKQYRFADGTLARNRPHANTLWIDDMYMSVPALAHLGELASDVTFFDDASRQVIQFSERMFNQEKGLFMHGWVKDMKHHPEFFWGRANGWALLAMLELLELLPDTHRQRDEILNLFYCHIIGITRLQSGSGFWHQLLDHHNSYEETSATAIFTYCIARAINKGYLGEKEYGPMVILAWNAVNSTINTKGQIEGTCVGTGMGFDPGFYYNRPVSVYAAHAYGPVLLAGSEVISFIKKHSIKIIENAFQIYPNI